MIRQIPLSELIPGSLAVIRSLPSAGPLRRRLMTAGFLENTPVRCISRSPLGDPSAYLIRDTVIALRNREAGTILVEPSGIENRTPPGKEPLLVLAGNPNVGKSTVFNALTGLRQHTGNWAGKTVESAQGFCRIGNRRCRIVDLPGCYSLLSGNAEENAARTFLLSRIPDAVIAVCDAVRLESTLPLTLQLMEMGLPVLLCVNLMDEAQRTGNPPDLSLLSRRLSIPVIGTAASRRDGLRELRQALASLLLSNGVSGPSFQIAYPSVLETALSLLTPAVRKARQKDGGSSYPGERCLCLQLLEAALSSSPEAPQHKAAAGTESGARAESEARAEIGTKAESGARGEATFEAAAETKFLLTDSNVRRAVSSCVSFLTGRGIGPEQFLESRDAACRRAAGKLCEGLYPNAVRDKGRSSLPDRLFTGKWTAFPVMLCFLFFLFWLTLKGANCPSALLSSAFFRLGSFLWRILSDTGLPFRAVDLLINGVYLTTVRVISVMLPPMAIFFPLFTLLEDAGILPRIAFNLDRVFQCCGTSGKQAITMCMVFEYL